MVLNSIPSRFVNTEKNVWVFHDKFLAKECLFLFVCFVDIGFYNLLHDSQIPYSVMSFFLIPSVAHFRARRNQNSLKHLSSCSELDIAAEMCFFRLWIVANSIGERAKYKHRARLEGLACSSSPARARVFSPAFLSLAEIRTIFFNHFDLDFCLFFPSLQRRRRLLLGIDHSHQSRQSPCKGIQPSFVFAAF